MCVHGFKFTLGFTAAATGSSAVNRDSDPGPLRLLLLQVRDRHGHSHPGASARGLISGCTLKLEISVQVCQVSTSEYNSDGDRRHGRCRPGEYQALALRHSGDFLPSPPGGMGRTGSWMFGRNFDAGAAFVLRRTGAVTRQWRAFMPALPLAPMPLPALGRDLRVAEAQAPGNLDGAVPVTAPQSPAQGRWADRDLSTPPGVRRRPGGGGPLRPGQPERPRWPRRPARPARSGPGPGPRWPGRGGSARVHVARGVQVCISTPTHQATDGGTTTATALAVTQGVCLWGGHCAGSLVSIEPPVSSSVAAKSIQCRAAMTSRTA
jgi:hypothetical protein